MANYEVHGPFTVPVYQGKGGKTITKAEVDKFWEMNSEFVRRKGCYIFGWRAGKGKTPIYVGKAAKGFKQEVFHPHKLGKYHQCLASYAKGTPILFFVCPAPGSRGALNETEIEAMEDFLIQTGVAANEDLLNVKGTKKASWSIKGLVRSNTGKPTKSATALKKTLNLG